MCGSNKKKIAASTPSKKNKKETKTTTTKEPSSVLAISPIILIASLLFGVPLAYRAGRLIQRDVLMQHGVPTVQHSNATITERSPQEALLDEATYRRTVMTKVGGPYDCETEVCPSTQEEGHVVLLEEVIFIEAFGQYMEDDDVDKEEEADPIAAHVIMDIERVDAKFLSNAERVRQAIFDTVWEASIEHDMAIMSVHCHATMALGGLVCAAILKDGNHMTVMTDPIGKLCSLDLLFVTPGHLINVVPIMKKYFGVGDEPLERFRQTFRGQRSFDGRWTTMDNDITEYLLEYKNHFFFKNDIGSLSSNFQEIDVWEGLNPELQSVDGYERSLSDGLDNYYTQHPELFHPNRMLYMDGVMQSSTIGDEAYHEGLVHPAMFAHAEGPKRVAIIGGGEGATLREILKHKSVEVCTMIEIDPAIVQASRAWLPSMNDCSEFGAGNCFDEARTELRLEDAFGYFLNRFKREGNVSEDLRTDPYDVIVMDALDPDDTIEFAVQLYKDAVFWGTLHEALTENGILVVQLGMTPSTKSYGEQFGDFKNRDNLFKSIEGAGFEQMFIYHDSHSDFKFPWSYMIACKSTDCTKDWQRNEAEVNLRVHERILPSKSGKPTLKYFDGATMQSYLRPYKSWETVHCRKAPMPQECSLFENIQQPISWDDAFDIVSDDNGENVVLVPKINLTAGTVIYDDGGNVDAPSFSHASSPFAATVDGVLYSRPTCGVTQKLADFDLSGKISPLRERQSHLFDMLTVTKDAGKGQQFTC